MEDFHNFSTVRELRDALNQVEEHMLDMPLQILVEANEEFGIRGTPGGENTVLTDIPLSGGGLEVMDFIEDSLRITYVRLLIGGESSKKEEF
jgi:hypothetical protein